MARILIIDDEQSICWGLARLCQQLAIESATASSAEAGLELAEKTEFDAIIMDVRLPGLDGLSAIEQFRKQFGAIPIVIITAFGDLRTAIDAVQKGAFEYIVKPFELDHVRATIQQALVASGIRKQASPERLDAAAGKHADQFSLIGSSPIMQEVYKQIALATTSDSPVLVTGESGTGKELTARSIHRFGPRSDRPMVAVNIAALNPGLAESELFGHVKGAFTGADSDRQGLVQQAEGGTLFLDEVAEIPFEIQVKLLRVLDLGEIVPVGANVPVKVDFRLISATNQNLHSQVNHGEFRHDLFYRLRTLEIQLPPLRERVQDIPELVRHFLPTNPVSPITIAPGFLASLMARSWPGNVRELNSVVARAATLAPGGVLTADQVDHDVAQGRVLPGSSEMEIQQLVSQWTRDNWNHAERDDLYQRLLEVIDPAILPTAFSLSDHQYSAAARRLGIHRTTLKKKLDEMSGDDSGESNV